jgi:Ca-activated chloride channel family protein
MLERQIGIFAAKRVSLVVQVLALVLSIYAAGAGLMAQAPASPGVPGQNPADTFTLQAHVNLVVLHATVLYKDGHHAEDLRKRDFRVYEDGTPQKLSVFSHADVPVTVGIIIDDSGSMRELRPAVDRAAWTFVKTSNPNDQVFVVTFNWAYQFDLPHPFATNMEQLKSALNSIDSRGGTALYDATFASLDHLDLGNRDKKVLLIITDGDDNSSLHTFSQLIRYEEQSDAEIYTIGLLDGWGKVPWDKYEAIVLKKMAEVTGGKAFFPGSLAQVGEICEHVAHRIRDQYTLGYYPTNIVRDGSFRTVKVVAVDPSTDEPLVVKTRPGYYAPGSPSLASVAPSASPAGLR